MSFFGGKGEGKEAEGAGFKSAAPPSCPRCEVVKAQATRTVVNYQKAHRKKVEALRIELKAARSQSEQLQKQVRRLKRVTRIHVPSILLGAGIGALVARVVKHLRQKSSETNKPAQQGDSGAAAAASTSTAAV